MGMQVDEFIVANIKCHGCITTIKNELMKLQGVHEVEINKDQNRVKVGHEGVNREQIINKLHALGYPEATEENGLLLQLKSYASCLVGRYQNI